MSLDSFPAQINVVVQGYLPDGCTEIDKIMTEREGNNFNINISTKRPKDAMCTLALVPFNETIPLDVQGLKSGNYTVNLTGSDANGMASKSVTVNVMDPRITPTIDWNNPADITDVIALSSTQLNAVATDPVTGSTVAGNCVYTPPEGTLLSVGPNTLRVDFTPTDTAKYTSASNVVTINVIDSGLPVADFRAVPTTGYAPLYVQFTDHSEDATGWNWNFGDGNTSISKNPSHTYYKAGNYNVSLTVNNENGTDTQYLVIPVQDFPAPIVSFTASPMSGNAPLSVKFTDTSRYATARSWDFNSDGVSDSIDLSPVYTYSTAGNYIVNLKVSNAKGTASKSATITALDKPILPVFLGYTNPPTDPNHDYRYEDVNGNGIQDFDDVVAYYDNMDWIGENVPVALFDYNNNTLIDFDDISKLYGML